MADKSSARITSGNELDAMNALIKSAKALGADGADVILAGSVSLSVSCRLGALEDIERSESQDLGLRVFVGQQQATVSSSDTSSSALQELAERAVAMAKAAPEDPYCGLADKTLLETDAQNLDLADSYEPDTKELERLAIEAEDAAQAIEGITNSDGAGASYGLTEIALATSDGFNGQYQRSSYGMGVSVIAGEGTGMESDYAQTRVRHFEDMESAREIGELAGNRTVARLNPRKVETTEVPVIYHPRCGGSLLGHLSGAINGNAVARGTSFLKDRMDQAIFGSEITVVDDPHRPRGLASKPFDGEGVHCQRRNLIDNGQLTSWLLCTSSARQLDLQTTGHAARGTSAPPAASSNNLYMEPGEISPDDLMADIKEGFFITDLIGMGVNGVTGDYSRGASGFWIESGEIAFAVSELTVAGNLKDMFMHLTPANDLEFRYGTNVPTLRIEGMTVAGK